VRQGGLQDPPLCIVEERRERKEAGLGRGRHDMILGERGECGAVGT
jgi:hypothetical protein